MKILIVFAGVIIEPSDWPSDRSLALQRLAGSNVLGHILNQLKDVRTSELVLLVDRDRDEIAAWLEDRLPELKAKVVAVSPGLTPLQALALCREQLDRDQWLLVVGSHITEADYKDLDQSEADITILVKPDQANTPTAVSTWAGLCHFHQGTDLQTALAGLSSPELAGFPALLNVLFGRERQIVEQPATLSLDAGTIDGFLFANARLLGLGYGSEDAIERSYVEDFTVIPPVFLHETAVIENAVVGPFANIEAGAVVRGSVIRDTLIGRQSTVENVVLDGSFIGDNARVQASGHALIVKDQKEILLTAGS